MGRSQTWDERYVLAVSDLGYEIGGFRLEGVEFSVGAGEGVGVIGTNGAGKTTLIRLAAGLLRPSGGQVLICGLPSRNWGRVSQHLGYVQQSKELPDGVTVETYLKHQLKLRRADPARYSELILAADLRQYERRSVRTLSGGSQRKLHVICAVAHRPSLLVLDEVTSGLDPTAQEAVLELLLTLKKEGVGILFASHHRHELVALADSVVVVHQGRQILDASLSDVLQSGELPTLVLEAFSDGDPGPLRSWAAELPRQYPVVRSAQDVERGVCLELSAGEHPEAITEVVALAHAARISLRAAYHTTPTLAQVVRSLIVRDAEETA